MANFIDNFKRYCGSASLSWIIIINMIVFVGAWVCILLGNALGLKGNFTLPWLCVSSLPEIALVHPWTILTYTVTQYDILHLLFNMLWLFWFGTLLPSWHPDRSRTWLYAGGGISGALCYITVNAIWHGVSSPGAYLCGSSASVLSIMAAAAVYSPDRRVNLLLIGSVKLKWVSIVCIALTFFGVGGGNSGAQSAHIGGVCFGLLFSLLHMERKLFHTANAPRQPIRKAPKILHKRRSDFSPSFPSPSTGKEMPEGEISLDEAQRQLDLLLDKIRLSGYSSLTSSEKNRLNNLSQILDKNLK